ncbi:MAG TPA: four-carbon acid sugar kinase family protein [Streptosporangiaceae bacterium]|nr:four-carbon acid sugar kinase family protein [Streptosporangiaceae bacterium]
MPAGHLPAAPEVFADLPPARSDGARLRESIRALRTADSVLLGVLDDDPTGSQAVHGVEVVTAGGEEVYAAALAGPAATCFVLTNTRSLAEPAASELAARVARGLMGVADRLDGSRIQIVSRSDSTLRGHLVAEVRALQAARRHVAGAGFDGVLLVPAFIEAGRLTAADIHWARTSSGLVPVGQTEFARDAAFGYASSDLKDFIAEKSGGAVSSAQVRSLSLADIRAGGPGKIRDVLAGLAAGAWLIANATEYSDLEAVAYGALLAERDGKALLYRTGPSFVRALAGLEPREPLRGADLRWSRPGPGGHGLIVAGSHVAQTGRQLAVLRARHRVADVELDVPALMAGRRAGEVAALAARQATAALSRSDVLLYTSRTVASGRGAEDSLAVGRAVSAALASAAGQVVSAGRGPAWIVAKGGITAHDVAVHGLRIRRAEVAGQLFPGMISVFRPIDAAPAAMGVPYVVFPGNVGGDEALADVVHIMNGGVVNGSLVT